MGKKKSKKGGSRLYFENSSGNMLKSKRSMELEVLGWWILGIMTLVAVVIAYIYLRSNGFDAIEFIKNLFTTRR